MTCEEFNRILPLYLAKNYFEIEDVEAFEKHAASCDKCWDAFIELNNAIEMLRSTKPKPHNYDEIVKRLFDSIDGVEREGVKYLIDREVNKLVEETEKYLAEGDDIDATKCLMDALELKPGDEEIGKRILEIMPLELFIDYAEQPQPLAVQPGGIFSIIEEPAIVCNVRVDWAGQEECSHSFFESMALGERSGFGEGEKIEPVTFGSSRITVQVEKMGDAIKIVIKFK